MEQINNNYFENEVERGSHLNEFLWICAGVDRKLLRQCPTDWSKYAGQGGLILFTALMAMLSGGYAFSTIFYNTWLSIGFGIFWGLLIFNLDRFIVNTMYSDGKYTISWAELGAGTPRLIIAVFIGLVISTPLELKIFEDRIEYQIIEDNTERAGNIRRGVNEKLDDAIKRRDLLEAEYNEIHQRWTDAMKDLKNEAEGTSKSGKVGRGSIWKDKKEYFDGVDREQKDWESKHQAELSSLILLIQQTQIESGEQVTSAMEDKGFTVRYEAFNNVKKKSMAVRIVSLFITLLFIIIEVCPTFFRMMVASGPYDCLLDAERHAKKVSSMKTISDLNDNINTEIRISTEKNRNRLEAEVVANREVLNRIALAQADLLQEAIDAWREEELIKIHSNPSDYIRTNMSERDSNTTNTRASTNNESERPTNAETETANNKMVDSNGIAENSNIEAATSSSVAEDGETANTETITSNSLMEGDKEVAEVTNVETDTANTMPDNNDENVETISEGTVTNGQTTIANDEIVQS